GSRAGRIFVVWIPHRQASGHPTSGRNIMSDGYDDSSYEHDHSESHDHYEQHEQHEHHDHHSGHDSDPYGRSDHYGHEDPHGANVITADFGPDGSQTLVDENADASAFSSTSV